MPAAESSRANNADLRPGRSRASRRLRRAPRRRAPTDRLDRARRLDRLHLDTPFLRTPPPVPPPTPLGGWSHFDAALLIAVLSTTTPRGEISRHWHPLLDAYDAHLSRAATRIEQLVADGSPRSWAERWVLSSLSDGDF